MDEKSFVVTKGVCLIQYLRPKLGTKQKIRNIENNDIFLLVFLNLLGWTLVTSFEVFQGIVIIIGLRPT